MSMNNKQIIEKLEIIIKLLAIEHVKGKEVREQILFLHQLGINNKEIAEILDKSQNTVNVTLFQARKKKKKGEVNE